MAAPGFRSPSNRRSGDRRVAVDRRGESERRNESRAESDRRQSDGRRTSEERRSPEDRRKEGSDRPPPFRMLDSVHPEAVREIAEQPGESLFIAASKSGGTIETSCFEEFFLDAVGADRMVAITDPGSPLEERARDRSYKECFLAPPEVGGRFSALTEFGIVSSMLADIPVRELLDGAVTAQRSLEAGDSPAVTAGSLVGDRAMKDGGRIYLSIVCEPGLESVGLWLDQLVAESTGKDGKGVIPLVGLEKPAPDTPVVRIGSREWLHDSASGGAELHCAIDSLEDLGAFFFEMEVLTAIAAARMRVHPFNQPNVAESKSKTADLLSTGRTFEPKPAVGSEVTSDASGYVALLAFAPPGVEWASRLDEAAARLAGKGLKVTWNFGPRYLHSSGQLHKGGPAVGRFVQILASPNEDLAIPGREYGFARLLRAQADGDFEAIEVRGLPIIRVNDPADIE